MKKIDTDIEKIELSLLKESNVKNLKQKRLVKFWDFAKNFWQSTNEMKKIKHILKK